nr:hypothetical protein [Paraburkholderia phenazinium]
MTVGVRDNLYFRPQKSHSAKRKKRPNDVARMDRLDDFDHLDNFNRRQPDICLWVDYLPLAQCKGRIAAVLALIYPPGIGIVVPGERFDERSQPMLDYFLVFEEAFNRFPGFEFEVQGVYADDVDGKIVLHTYVVKE